MKRTALTLIELVVVLAIMGAMLFPTMQNVRHAALETTCKSNLRQIQFGLSQHNELLGMSPPNPNRKIAGWTIDVLPFIDQANLKEAIPIGGRFAQLPSQYFRQPPILRCPAQEDSRSDTLNGISSAHYVMVTNATRNSYFIADASTTFFQPWIVSPKVISPILSDGTGPHKGGYFGTRPNDTTIEIFLPN